MVQYIRSIDYLFLHFFVLDFAIVLILCGGGGLWSIEIDTIKEKKKFQFHELTDDLDIVIIITGIV